MRSPRSLAVTDRWVLVLGPLLIVGLLVQSVSVRPCSQTAGAPDSPGSTMTSAAAATPGACAGALAMPVVRAVPAAWQGGFVGGDPDVDGSASQTPVQFSGADADRRGPLLLVSLVLETLRPVVLQI